MQKCIFYILWYVKSATLIHCNSLPLFRTNISIDTCVDTSWLLIQWSHSEWRGWGFGHGFSWNFAANRQEKRPTHPFTQNPKMENVCQPLAKELNSASCGQVWGKNMQWANEPMSLTILRRQRSSYPVFSSRRLWPFSAWAFSQLPWCLQRWVFQNDSHETTRKTGILQGCLRSPCLCPGYPEGFDTEMIAAGHKGQGER